MENRNNFNAYKISRGFTKVEVFTSVDDDFVHRIARQDALMFLHGVNKSPDENGFFNDDYAWQNYFRYYVEKDASGDNWRFVFYIFNLNVVEAKTVLRSILNYFDFNVVSIQEVYGIEDRALTQYDVRRLFRMGNKFVEKLCWAATSPLGGYEKAKGNFDEFLTLFSRNSEILAYFTDFASRSVDVAMSEYHRPIVRGTDGFLYSQADMDDAMMNY